MHITQEDLDNRFTYHPPNGPDLVEVYQRIRAAAKEVAEFVVLQCPPGRETSLSVTHLEEAVFWANAALARQNA